MSVSAERITAARFLLRVEEGAFSSRVLSGRRQAGVRTRVLGVLRWRRSLDSVLSRVVSRPWSKVDPETKTALRLGLYEIVMLKVPKPVATDGAVHLVRSLGKSSAAGLVNAVLRRAPGSWSEVERSGDLGVRFSHPEWLCARWISCFGSERTGRILAADQGEARLWAWFLDPNTAQRLCDDGVRLEAHPWCPDAWSAPEDVRALVREIEDGTAYAQDPSSQLVAVLAARMAPPRGRIVDLCAAPGGKAARIARDLPGSDVIAMDLRLKRARIAQRLLSRLRSGITVTAADGVRSPLRSRSAEIVLLDAPCSGTGTLRRHPEIRWRLEPAGIEEMAAIQRKLLKKATEIVSEAGVLIYATCSIEPEENEHLLRSLPPGFEIVDLEESLPEVTPIETTAAGGVRVFPSVDGDGFSIHALKRVMG